MTIPTGKWISSLFVPLVLLAMIGMAHSGEILSADKAAVEAEANRLFLVDIRRPDEWKQTGVASTAHLNSMQQKGFLERLTAITGGKKDAPVALICATGMRSTWLAAELVKRGYTNILNVREGMMGSQHGPGWLRRGLSIRSAQ